MIVHTLTRYIDAASGIAGKGPQLPWRTVASDLSSKYLAQARTPFFLPVLPFIYSKSNYNYENHHCNGYKDKKSGISSPIIISCGGADVRIFRMGSW